MAEAMFRVGTGYDIHRLVEERKLILGGVEIPSVKGLQGHSDADVLLHAIANALLGAVGEKDLGEHFPNTDPRYANISSVELLRQVYAVVQSKGFGVVNVDTTILAEEPKLTPFKPAMVAAIANTLHVPASAVNVKATTSEGLGPIGQNEAMAAHAVVLVQRAA